MSFDLRTTECLSRRPVSGQHTARAAGRPHPPVVIRPVYEKPQTPQQMGIDLSNYLSHGSLLVMIFTTFWFLRYARLGKRIADPDLVPPRASVERTLWIGLREGRTKQSLNKHLSVSIDEEEKMEISVTNQLNHQE